MSTTSWTGPSHATLFTGRYPHDLTYSDKTRYNGRYATLAEVFGLAGYRAGAFISNTHYVSGRSGLLTGFNAIGDKPATITKSLITNSWLGRRLVMLFVQRSDAGALERWGGFVRKSAPEVNSEFLRSGR